MMEKKRAPFNRTLTLDEGRRKELAEQLRPIPEAPGAADLENRIFHDDLFRVIDKLPSAFVDLMILDPPYNLDKDFNGLKFSQTKSSSYLTYLKSWFPKLMRLLKPQATVYLCGDWRSSADLYQIMNQFLYIQNRITWQREKGRGAKTNWKNCCEDIWFGTKMNSYYFNVDAVKMKRVVIAPYKKDGLPKDWEVTDNGKFRMTYPSNFWDDISIPYWSMPENTDHPTQKPEKLIAKLILASCPPDGLVFDPFLGSGTTAVTAKKLNRKYAGIELCEEYCCWALERLERAESDSHIQGYDGGVFWERNSAKLNSKASRA